LLDKTALVEIYNRMMTPARPKTTATYSYAGDRVMYSHTVNLHVFRVDSPMKGAVSADDEARLSFQVASIDTASWTLTVRECLWNAEAGDAAPAWGESRTVSVHR